MAETAASRKANASLSGPKTPTSRGAANRPGAGKRPVPSPPCGESGLGAPNRLGAGNGLGAANRPGDEIRLGGAADAVGALDAVFSPRAAGVRPPLDAAQHVGGQLDIYIYMYLT